MAANESLKSYLDEEDEDDEEEDPPADPPVVRRRRSIGHPYKDHAIGTVVWVYNRGDGGLNGYLTPRNREPGPPSRMNPSGKRNLFEKFDSYPITTSVLGKLQYYEVERIFVLERESRILYEYRMEDYLNAPSYEWERRSGRVDEQKCPGRDDAFATWIGVRARDLVH